ncbi:MAG: hypothetical protein U9N59_15475, partial [Campylobacterota bacterium]|nr:hypothetical protein [Campylobacterota bacterium]
MSDSKEVFKLRKEKQLGDAYTLALKLYNEDSSDEWIQKAYAWVLIDIVKIEINNNNTTKAQLFFNQLQSIDFYGKDEILTKQIELLKPKLNTNYQEIQQAEQLSKNGNHQASIELFRKLYKTGKLSNEHHQSFGWAIYRLLSNNQDNLNINNIKQYLMEYLKLNNKKPEMLHSFIFQFTVIYASKHNDFNIYKFFQMWNPQYLRDEDKEKQYNDGKTYPSLVEKFIRLLVDKNYNFDVNYLQETIQDNLLVIETIRETFFWKLFNFHKNKNLKELWNTFNFYVNNFSNFGESHWHSEILKLSNRFMIEENSWRFFNFFYLWGYQNLRYEDWEEEINGENTYKPLARKSLSLINKHIKSNDININDLSWVLELYNITLEKFKDDTWLLREYATLLYKINKIEEAIEIYKNIILDLSDQAYVWHEFSKLLENIDINISISMLCKAITIQKNEDFLDQIHLDLAKLLIKKEFHIEAKTELSLYEKHRLEKGWKLAEEFVSLNNKLLEVNANKNNKTFYNNNIELAENYIYNDIEWTDLLLFEKFKTKDNKERIVFVDLNTIELAINPYKFKILKSSKTDEVYKLKLHYDKSNEKYIALKIQKSNLEKKDLIANASTDIAIVDHINNDKKLFHYVVNRSIDGIVRFNQTKFRPKAGDFIEIQYFKTYNKNKKEYRTHILDIKKTDKTNTSLLKEISGDIRLNYKNGKIAFGFVDDYYIPGFLLNKLDIEEDDYVFIKMIFNPKEIDSKKQWKV